MMKFICGFIIILVFVTFFSCKKNTSPIDAIPFEFSSSDDSNIPDSIRSLYRLDAAFLALNHIYKNKLDDTASVRITEQLIESFYSGLIHIYNCKTIPSIETITKTWPVHTPAYSTLQMLVVGIDMSYNWTLQWVNGFKFTGNDTIDSLLVEYELELSTGYYSHRFITLFSDKPLNMPYLGKIFEKISGIIYAESHIITGGWNYIKANLESLYVKYIFSIGWGDCPAGCIYRHFWEYTVSNRGEVRFLGSYGDTFDLQP